MRGDGGGSGGGGRRKRRRRKYSIWPDGQVAVDTDGREHGGVDLADLTENMKCHQRKKVEGEVKRSGRKEGREEGRSTRSGSGA